MHVYVLMGENGLQEIQPAQVGTDFHFISQKNRKHKEQI